MVFISMDQLRSHEILLRVLGEVERGCYFDLDARVSSHSVTQSFYERGWRGINLQAERREFERLRQFRPLDLNFWFAGGPRDEPARLTRESRDSDDMKPSFGDIWGEHARGEVHFLRVDGKGVGSLPLDLEGRRPWIILVASVPLGGAEDPSVWEGPLLDLGYSLEAFDGTHWYYLAQERTSLRSEFRRCHSTHRDGGANAVPALVPSASRLRQQRDRLLELLVSNLGGFEANLHPHLAPHLTLPLPSLADPGSQLCTQNQLDEDLYQLWCSLMREAPCTHRKQWEFVYILQVLWTRGMLAPGRKGLGFGCGNEPLASAMATHGCEVVATDLDPEDRRSRDWQDSAQHAAGRVEALNDRGICPAALFSRRVSYRNVDMNRIPDDLRGFDFVWSSCALEHIGSLRNGLDFIRQSMHCLRPGGVAVHTTEFNLTSNGETLESPGLSLFRLRDMEQVANELRQEGHEVAPFNLNPGGMLQDRYVDLPPFAPGGDSIHLRLQVGEYAITSIGLVVRKKAAEPLPEGGPEGEGVPFVEAELQRLLAAIDADPTDPDPFLALAGLLEGAGDFLRGRHILEAGLDQNPTNERLWQALIDQSSARGDVAGAARDAADALRQLPTGGRGTWHLRVARHLRSLAAHAEARTVLDQGIKSFPTSLPLVQLRAASIE